jgi:hypothetical protein
MGPASPEHRGPRAAWPSTRRFRRDRRHPRGPLAAPAAATGVKITLNSVGDVAGNDGLCSMRAAMLAANTNTASGALTGVCTAGWAAGSDAIVFGFARTGR